MSPFGDDDNDDATHQHSDGSKIVMLSDSQFAALLNGQHELREEQIDVKRTLKEHVAGEEVWRNRIAGDVNDTKSIQIQMSAELKRNTEATQVVIDLMETGKVVVTVASWVHSSVKWSIRVFLGAVALLVAIKTMFTPGDQSIYEWLVQWWRSP